MTDLSERLERFAKLQGSAARSVGRIQKQAEALFREADDLDQLNEELADLAKELSANGSLSLLKVNKVPGRVKGVRVARELRIVHCADGFIEFRFKLEFRIEKVMLRLTPQLGELLVFLCSSIPDKDGLVGWRTSDELKEYIKRESQTGNPQRYVNQMLYRLREALADAGLDRDMIQRNKKRGIRFSAEPVKKGGNECGPGTDSQ